MYTNFPSINQEDINFKGKICMQFSECFVRLIPKTNYCRKNIFQGVLVPLYQENEKLGQSDKRGRNDPDDNDPEKVTKLNMKCSLVLNTAIYICRMLDLLN